LSTTDSQTAVPLEIPHIFQYTYVPSLPYMCRERRFSRLRIAKELLLYAKQTGTPLSPHKKKKTVKIRIGQLTTKQNLKKASI
jgi:hypothetical protein